MFTVFHQYKYLTKVFENFNKTLNLRSAIELTAHLNNDVTEHLLAEYDRGALFHEAAKEHFESKYCHLLEVHGKNFVQIEKIMKAELSAGVGGTVSLVGIALCLFNVVSGFMLTNPMVTSLSFCTMLVFISCFILFRNSSSL